MMNSRMSLAALVAMVSALGSTSLSFGATRSALRRGHEPGKPPRPNTSQYGTGYKKPGRSYPYSSTKQDEKAKFRLYMTMSKTGHEIMQQRSTKNAIIHARLQQTLAA
jgi:hypothetical protein